MSKFFEMCGHKLCAFQLEYDSIRRSVCVLDNEKGMAYLISYDKVVAVYSHKLRTLYRTWPHWTNTTSRHVDMFRRYLEKEHCAHFTYYIRKDKCTDYREYGPSCLPFKLLVLQTRKHIPLNYAHVNRQH